MSAKPPLHSLNRPAIERMLRIHRELQRHSFPNCSKLARELEVSSKTIGRDIDFMRDRMLLPIEYEPSRHGYAYTREVESLPTINISEGELLALSIARKSLDLYKGTPFEQPLAIALDKLAAGLPDTITANLSDLSETISFKHGTFSKVDESVLQNAIRATLDKREVAFLYKKPNTDSLERRIVHPYHITNYLGKWYLLGWDLRREAMRTFLLARASSFEERPTTFSIPDSFSAEDYLWKSFGIYSPTGDHEVRVRFERQLTDYISENIWHSSQAIELLPDGRIEIVFKLGSLIEVAQWVLGWGRLAEAVSPPELRELLLSEAQAIAQRYA